jgi:hypothetical protein
LKLERLLQPCSDKTMCECTAVRGAARFNSFFLHPGSVPCVVRASHGFVHARGGGEGYSRPFLITSGNSTIRCPTTLVQQGCAIVTLNYQQGISWGPNLTYSRFFKCDDEGISRAASTRALVSEVISVPTCALVLVKAPPQKIIPNDPHIGNPYLR